MLSSGSLYLLFCDWLLFNHLEIYSPNIYWACDICQALCWRSGIWQLIREMRHLPYCNWQSSEGKINKTGIFHTPSSFLIHLSTLLSVQVFIISQQSISISFASSSSFPFPFLLENSSFLFFSSSTIVISLSLVVLKASYGKESACSAVDPGSIPGSGRSPLISPTTLAITYLAPLATRHPWPLRSSLAPTATLLYENHLLGHFFCLECYFSR